MSGEGFAGLPYKDQPFAGQRGKITTWEDLIAQRDAAQAELRVVTGLAERLADALDTIRNAPITGSPHYPIEDWWAAVEQVDGALAAFRERKSKSGPTLGDNLDNAFGEHQEKQGVESTSGAEGTRASDP